MKHFLLTTIILGFSINATFCSGTEVIDFDDLNAGFYPWDALSASGVTFLTGDIPDSIVVGGNVTLTNIVSQFEVSSSQNAISPPNFVKAYSGGQKDILISFTTPVTSVTLTSDDTNESHSDLIRLLALEPTGNPNEFTVLAFDEGYDNVQSSPDNLLTVDLSGAPFEFVIFQTTTEEEGFDDLTFTIIPEPTTLLLLGLGGLLLRKRRR